MFGPFAEAALLGIVHGVCEFLPLSSEGHRALARLLFKLEGTPELFPLLRVASLLATIIVLWPLVARTARDGFGMLFAPGRFARTPAGRDAAVVFSATVPTLALGVILAGPARGWMRSPLAIGLGFLGTTAVLVLAHFAGPGDRERPGLGGAVLLGVAQGLSVLPGFSRSGSTIALALLLGVKPPRAFELSLLLSLPAAVLGLVLETKGAFLRPFFAANGLQASALLGALVALLTGVLVLPLLRGLVVRGLIGWFAFWVGPLALATLGLALSWPS
jgi:undecaprenyl-diphosphatase